MGKFYITRGKRWCDIIGAMVGLICFSPFFLILPIVIKLQSKGPVIYKQDRVGENGMIFKFYKFRTMCENAEAKTGPVWTQIDDPRITKIGRILRKIGLDELPQFINVLKGDMSIVGPRPERPFFVNQHSSLRGERLTVKPGLFGPCEIEYGFSDDYAHEDLPPDEKAKRDIAYIRDISFLQDIKITISVILKCILGKMRFW